ncbi:hypothetical protein R2R70_02220 [Cobetia sp. SIMBA_158]|uniref:hypothetical protein n=1 Tax=Cobetia sp. SIMBA_158 TaxID=3081617 RepID=UPI0039810D26
MHKSFLTFIFTVVMIGVFASLAHGAMRESAYQNEWCGEREGQVEYVLQDRARVDCLLPEYAVEVDFDNKWAEAIGQALYYAAMTGKKPAVLLIVGHNQERYLARFQRAAAGLGITLFLIEE